MAVVFEVGVEVLLVLVAPPNEKPPDVPAKGLLAGGCENEKDADRPSVDPVEAAGVEPNMGDRNIRSNGIPCS